MDDYLSRLILSYFFNMEKEYDIGELMQLTGKDSRELTTIIEELLNDDYIEYNNYELQITQKGKMYLISKDSLIESFFDDCLVLRNIDPQSALPLEETYVPKQFKHKYKK